MIEYSAAPWSYTCDTCAMNSGRCSVTVAFSRSYSAGNCDHSAVISIIRGEFDDDEAALAAYDAAWETVMAETLAAGARISHHHGIGLERARWMPDELGQGLEVMRSLQRSLDPAGIMNPGKLGL